MFRMLMELALLNRDEIMIDLSNIAPAFIFLVDRGLVMEINEYQVQNFGNATLVMKGDQFSLRFKRDRGQIFVDVGNETVGWHKLEYVLEFVDNSITQKQLGEPPALDVMADLLQERWNKVANLFSDKQSIVQFESFAKQKSVALIDRIFHR